MNGFNPRLRKLMDCEPQKASWLFRFAVKEMQKMSATLLTYYGWQAYQLSHLNTSQFKSELDLFEFIPERELWMNRNKAYSYWM